jgi:hypothetical protein
MADLRPVVRQSRFRVTTSEAWDSVGRSPFAGRHHPEGAKPMEVSFDVDGTPAEFRRNRWTGRSELQVGSDVMTLQSPLRLSTHFDFKTRTVWKRRANEHEVEIVKVRPHVLGGLRSTTYTVTVDDTVVADVHA